MAKSANSKRKVVMNVADCISHDGMNVVDCIT